MCYMETKMRMHDELIEVLNCIAASLAEISDELKQR